MFCPLADAAISRQPEIAADHGLALKSAAADGRLGSGGGPRRLLISHPTAVRRIRALLAATAASRV